MICIYTRQRFTDIVLDTYIYRYLTLGILYTKIRLTLKLVIYTIYNLTNNDNNNYTLQLMFITKSINCPR